MKSSYSSKLRILIAIDGTKHLEHKCTTTGRHEMVDLPLSDCHYDAGLQHIHSALSGVCRTTYFPKVLGAASSCRLSWKSLVSRMTRVYCHNHSAMIINNSPLNYISLCAVSAHVTRREVERTGKGKPALAAFRTNTHLT